MAITTYTLDQLTQMVSAYYKTRFPSKDLTDESWLGKQWRAIAMALLTVEKSIQDCDFDATPSANTSTAALDGFAYLFGLPSNAGGYGRNSAVQASGGAGPCTGTAGTTFASGAQLLASDGVTVFQLVSTVTIPGGGGSGSIVGAFAAVTAGIAGNLPINSILSWQSPPPGADATVVLTGSGLTGGLDGETDTALLQRIYDRLQQPPKGGAPVDYRTWAQAGTPLITRAYVYPLHGGTGTVHTVLTTGGSGTARKPTVTAQGLSDAYVATVRPAAMAGYLSLLPAMPALNGLTILARMKPSAAIYNFDWIDTLHVYTVAGYTPPAGALAATLTINWPAPATLQAAIAGALLPGLQVSSTGKPPVMVPVHVTAIDGTFEVLTLENPLPTGWIAPTVGDRVYANGPVVAPIAAALLAYVDGLGPSRADGYADPNDPWEDTCAIARLTRCALDVTATDGVTVLASNLAIAGGMTINGAAVDVQGAADIAGAPELLYAASILVTQ